MASVLDIAEAPGLQDQTAFNLAVWTKLQADPFYATLEHRIETDAFGQIVMSPLPNSNHGARQSQISYHLHELMAGGVVVTECPISTSEGIKGADVAWASPARRADQEQGVFVRAPEICVEVISPSNTTREMENKRRLYFESGAEEVWLCGQDGNMTFFLAAAPEDPADSARCPTFPKKISLD